MTTEEKMGDIIIAPEVIEVIVGIAASKVEGVFALRNKRLADRIGKKAEGSGVYLREEDGKVIVDIYVFLNYGVNVPQVAMDIQSDVKAAVSDMSDINIDDVNIHVSGVVPEKTEKLDFSDIFDEGFLDVK
jgi:uncharacterized alkaline shock family protein YloU